MKTGTAILLCLLGIAGTGAGRGQPVVISEFKATKSDWLELWNRTQATIDLTGWYLTDDPEFLPGWRIPGLTLGSNESRVIFCFRYETNRLRTDFRLAGGGGYLALVAPDGTSVVHEFAEYPAQVKWASYGFPLRVPVGQPVEVASMPNYLSPRDVDDDDDRNLPIQSKQFAGLRVTEILFQPAPPEAGSPFAADDFEFIEFYTDDPYQNFKLGLSGGDIFFGDNVSMGTNEFFLIVANRAAFESRYGAGLPIAGEYRGRLSKGPGVFTVWPGQPWWSPPSVVKYKYDDKWHPLAVGLGFSLVSRDPDSLMACTPEGWRPSAQLGGSPGRPDPPSTMVGGVVVNEILTRPAPPFEEAVELMNVTDREMDVSGWFLTDQFTRPKKFRIPDGAVIPAGGFLAMDEHTFNPDADESEGFKFRNSGEAIYLFSADTAGNLTGYAHGFEFGPAEENVTFGRHVTSTGEEHFVRQESMTFFETNSGPRVGPLVISEIMYHPPGGRAVYFGTNWDNLVDEYIELYNVADQPIALGPSPETGGGWRLRDAVDYEFPAGTVLPPGGYLLVVGFNPSDTLACDSFRAFKGVPPEVPVFGPWAGKLGNSGDSAELVYVEPGLGKLNSGAEILVDRVRYSRNLPWPRIADEYGASLQRLDTRAYGNDPANWRASAPTPGRPRGTGPVPIILASPTSVTTAAGSTARLAIEAEPKDELRYQWYFRGAFGKPVSLYQADGAVLTLPEVQPTQSGRYTCFIFGAGGSISTTIDLAITDGAFKDSDLSLTVVHPAERKSRAAHSQITLTGHAAGSRGVAGVRIHRQPGATIHLGRGTTNWAATVPLSRGVNILDVDVFDYTGAVSPVQRVEIDYQPEAPVTLLIDGQGSIRGATNGQSLIVDQLYNVTARPARGYLFYAWETFEGKQITNHHVLSFAMSSNIALRARFVPDPFPRLMGTYYALFVDDGNPSAENAGSLLLRVGKTGRYSGVLRSRHGRRAIHGQFDVNLRSVIPVLTPQGTSSIITMVLSPDGENLTGTIVGPASQIRGFRRPVGVRRSPSHYDLQFLESVNPSLKNVGGGTLKVNRSGLATLRGKLGRMASLSQALAVSNDGRLPLFITHSAPAWTIFGWLHLSESTVQPVTGNLVFVDAGVIRFLQVFGQQAGVPAASASAGSAQETIKTSSP